MKASCLFPTLLLLLLANADALGKGYPDKIVIQGNDLLRPIEITDRQILGKFSPWYGEFIDWSNGRVSKTQDRTSYEVLFYISWRDKKSPQKPLQSSLIFNVLYSPDPGNGPGLIYLPARSDDKYRVNQAAITRDKDDGRWHQASLAWDAALRPLFPLKQSAVVVQPVTVSRTRSILPWLIVAVSLGASAVVLKKKFNSFALSKTESS